MSIQSARDFLTRLANDEKLRNGLCGCKTASERQQFALAAGFEFTSDEIAAARRDLQDADLDAVSGGVVTIASCMQDMPLCIPFPG